MPQDWRILSAGDTVFSAVLCLIQQYISSVNDGIHAVTFRKAVTPKLAVTWLFALLYFIVDR